MIVRVATMENSKIMPGMGRECIGTTLLNLMGSGKMGTQQKELSKN
jgi:hypothetical protein